MVKSIQSIAVGADYNAKDRADRSVLVLAVSGRHSGVAQQLISAGCDMECRDKYNGPTAFLRAAEVRADNP